MTDTERTYFLLGQAVRSWLMDKRGEWETIVEDEAAKAVSKGYTYNSKNGYFRNTKGYQEGLGPFGAAMPQLLPGERIRLTVDGESSEFEVKEYNNPEDPFLIVGNSYLEDAEDDNLNKDTGYDFAFIQDLSFAFSLYFLARNAGTYHVKIERRLNG